MKVYLNCSPSERNSIGLVAGNLSRELKSQGVECVSDVNRPWDVALAFITESRSAVYKKGPVVQRLDGIYLDRNIDYRQKNAPIRRTYDAAKGIIFQSEFSRNVATKNFGDPKGSHVVIHNGVLIDDSPDPLERLIETYPREAGYLRRFPTRIVAAAEWRPSKRLGSIIKGAEAYFEQDRDACLFVIGAVDESYSAKVASRTDRVRFVGRLPNEDVKRYYRVSSVCANLSIMDACPNSVVEAMAHGTPCLVTKHQGVVELMRPESGVVLDVDPWDYRPLAFEEVLGKIDANVVAGGIARCVAMGRCGARLDLGVSEMAAKYARFLKQVAGLR